MNAKMLPQLADKIGYPHGYRRTRRRLDPPFLVYYCIGSAPIASDTRMHGLWSSWRIELYTAGKDRAAEQRAEQALTDAGIVYQKDEVDIPAENLLEIIYEFEGVETE